MSGNDTTPNMSVNYSTLGDTFFTCKRYSHIIVYNRSIRKLKKSIFSNSLVAGMGVHNLGQVLGVIREGKNVKLT